MSSVRLSLVLATAQDVEPSLKGKCMKKMIICLSGGMDSAALLPYALQAGFTENQILTLSFDYGSKHNKYELPMAKALSEHFGVKNHVVALPQVAKLLSSSLLIGGKDIPEGHYEDLSMKETIVPGRNLIMLSIAAAIAESWGGEAVWMGMHAGDLAIYPDCRPAFVEAVNTVLSVTTGGEVSLFAPFLSHSKSSILTYGIDTVPYNLTRTCYKDQEIACGRCGACVERLEAFELIGRTDPLPYATL